jgi:hypothetical protein
LVATIDVGTDESAYADVSAIMLSAKPPSSATTYAFLVSETIQRRGERIAGLLQTPMESLRRDLSRA